MRRREFLGVLGGAVAAWPFTARAQQPSMPVIGYLAVRSPNADAPALAGFRQGLNEVDYIDGRNVAIEHKFVENQYGQLSTLASDLVHQQVAVIFATGLSAALAAKSATAEIPIVFTSGVDPVQYGLVTSLSRSGSNLTGISLFSATLVAKRLELLREILGKPGIIGFLVNPNNSTAEPEIKAIQAAARDIGQQLVVAKAGSEGEIDAAFATFKSKQAEAFMVSADSFLIGRRDQLVALAAQHSVPAIYNQREFSAAGGLMSYGASPAEMYRQAGTYVGRILKGMKPSDLPILQPTRFELIVNLKTAKALGLTVPLTLLGRADGLIE